ncbi:sigma-70 family RNA polymerase sigma factor [Asanoa sp. WMMD1127]|uniref:sigma-70 family RNA polymerase sigma factor n=1 Tax=Asanoa sp. WMMD1127 TaxID=3016107 RepID=UPI00241633C9|nr:sigma-70 family RNA polymerase sigma factor [Asanoa sp. WMMD1127]MDG4825810.1 sigma-70 family RNA polymerase sigma factor [Asanoa sp. WMMD1127]
MPLTQGAGPEAPLDAIAREYAEARRTGQDVAQRQELLWQQALPMADRLARSFAHRGEPIDDLRQVARLGMVKAVNGVAPDRGSFTGYAATTVRGELRRYFRDACWDTHVPRGVQELMLETSRAIEELTYELSREPTRSELCERLNVPADELELALQARQAYRARSLNRPAASEDAGEQSEEVGDLIGAPDRDLAKVDDVQTVRGLITRLPAREREILALRFYGNRSQAEIAAATGISQMHVSRLLSRTLEWLRAGLLTDTAAPYPGMGDEGPDERTLEIAVSNDRGVARIAVRGEIDHDNVDELRPTLVFCCRNARAGVAVDLRHVPFVDAAAIGALADAYRLAWRRGVRLVLVNPGRTVARSLVIAGLGGQVRTSAPARPPAPRRPR